MTTTNKQTKAFQYDNAANLSYELNAYICANLEADNITIEHNGKIIVFDWNYQPQTSGTIIQQLTYKNMTTFNKAHDIMKHINQANLLTKQTNK